MIELFPTPPRSDENWTLLDRKHRAAIQVISAVAILIAGYLVLMKWTGQISHLIGCGGDADCANILGGRWATWFLIPISGWCLLTYLTLFAVSYTGGRQPRSQVIIVFLSTLLATAAAWFMFLQIAVEQQLCPWCIGLHLLGISTFVIVFHGFGRAPRSARHKIATTAFGMTTIAMLLLITGQIWGPLPQTYQISDPLAETTLSPTSDQSAVPPEPEALQTEGSSDTTAANPVEAVEATSVEPTLADNESSLELPADLAEPATPARILRYFGGELEYKVGDVPYLGNKDADVFLVKYFDYTCHTCRDLHVGIGQLLEKYPSRLGVIVIPCPLNRSCNPHLRPGAKDHQHACELATIGLKVWRAAPEKFHEFHEAMFKHQGKVTAAKAAAYASTLVSKKKWDDVSLDLWVPETRDQAIAVYGVLSRSNGRMPKLLISENRVMHGLPRNIAELESLIFPSP